MCSCGLQEEWPTTTESSPTTIYSSQAPSVQLLQKETNDSESDLLEASAEGVKDQGNMLKLRPVITNGQNRQSGGDLTVGTGHQVNAGPSGEPDFQEVTFRA